MKLIAVFGAAVLPDGQPSPSLARRIYYALATAAAHPQAPILCSGGEGRHGPSEASVIAGRLGLYLAEERILPDEASRDTLGSVVAAARIVRARKLAGCVACSDDYHLPRIKLLFGMLGIRAESPPLDRVRAGTRSYWLRMRSREVAAIPYDALRLAAHRKKLLAELSAQRRLGE